MTTTSETTGTTTDRNNRLEQRLRYLRATAVFLANDALSEFAGEDHVTTQYRADMADLAAELACECYTLFVAQGGRGDAAGNAA